MIAPTGDASAVDGAMAADVVPIRGMMLRKRVDGPEITGRDNNAKVTRRNLDAFCAEHGISWDLEATVRGGERQPSWRVIFTKAIDPQHVGAALDEIAADFAYLLHDHVFENGPLWMFTMLPNGCNEVVGDTLDIGYDT